MKNKVFLSALLSVILMTTQGCFFILLGVGAGAAGVVYAKGALEANFNQPVDKLFDASEAALKKLEYFITDDDVARHEATIKGEDQKGKKVEIAITAITEKSAKINIRVGAFGDQSESQRILLEIEDNLNDFGPSGAKASLK